jgi:hypothetical protein
MEGVAYRMDGCSWEALNNSIQRTAILPRLDVRGTPSVAYPFGGTTLHRSVVFIRLTLEFSEHGKQKAWFLLSFISNGL